MLTMMIKLQPGCDPATIKAAMRERLDQRHGIAHVTIEVEDPASPG